MSNTKTIAKNTGWYSVESAIEQVVTLFTSIAIARSLGPSKMGYIIYVSWLASVVSSLGSFGIPATTRKYMAEFIGAGDRGTARYIYLRTLTLQSAAASVATAGIILWVISDASTENRWAAILIALSIWPAMVNSISAQANVASEDLFRNLPASATSILVFFFGITGTVLFHWGVLGVGASVLATRTVDCSVRLVPTLSWILTWETTHTTPEGLRRRALTFAWQSVATMALALIVWDRSEFFLLKRLCSDIQQVAFYSVAFSMAERLLLSSSIFGSATGATIFAQYGRDKTKIPRLAEATFRYLALTSIPLHTIFTGLAVPALLLLYGNQYRGAEAVVALAPLLCMSKAFFSPIQSVLQSIERQKWVIASTILAGIVDLGAAWLLIPTRGAVGACIANGIAQFTAVALMWGIGIYAYRIRVPWRLAAKVASVSVVAALGGHFVAMRLPPFWGVLLGGCVSLLILLFLFYVLRILEQEDRERLSQVADMLPRHLNEPIDRLLSVLTHSSQTTANVTNAEVS
jgi:O-antigen/teichoic acid export membrane protein